MRALESFLGERRASSREVFAKLYPHGFLLKRPGSLVFTAPVGVQTEHVEQPRQELPPSGEPLPERGAVPLVKRPAKPFPERLLIGRAPNCDVVVRASFISKVHAHVEIDDTGRLRVSDRGSANGTRLNGVPLGREPVAFMLGDRLELGTLPLIRVSADEIWSLLDEIDRVPRAERIAE